MPEDVTLSVSQLNEYVRRQLAADPLLRSVSVRGEVSGFKRAVSGHLYFSLKDETSKVDCAMFRQHAMGLAFAPRDGMRVTARGSASLYPRDGKFQLYVESLREEGVGDMYLRFEALKRRLQAEGLFDAAIKKPLPAFPREIGVVTSRTGAVLRDIVRVSTRRNPHIKVTLRASSVQGEGAAREIAEAIAYMNRYSSADVLLVGRGGGSMEDLWPFNEEIVARAIAASRIPVVSCVGHETDFTIADFVSDVRAPTPSAAAELAVPVLDDLIDQVSDARARLKIALTRRFTLERARLNALIRSPALARPETLLVEKRTGMVAQLRMRLLHAEDIRIAGERAKLDSARRVLAGMGPDAVLARGYAVLSDARGHVLPGVSALARGDQIDVRMADGRVWATVDHGK